MTFDPRPRLLALQDALGELLIAAGLPERTRSLDRPLRLLVSIPAAGLSAVRAPIALQAAPTAGLRLQLRVVAAFVGEDSTKPFDLEEERTAELAAAQLAQTDAATFTFEPLPSSLSGETLLELTFEAVAGIVKIDTSGQAPPALRLSPSGRPALLFGHGAAGAVARPKRPPLLSRDNWLEAARLLRKEGPVGLAARVVRRLTRPPPAPPAAFRDRYPEWLAAHAVADDISITRWRAEAEAAGSPSFAVLLLPGQGDPEASRFSVAAQRWPAAGVIELLALPGAPLREADEAPANGLWDRLAWPKLSADYFVPLAAGDVLAPHALLRFAAAAAGRPALITADEDAIEPDPQAPESHRRGRPFFKPGLTLSRLRCEDYVAGVAAFRNDARFAGGPLRSWEGLIWDAALRRAEAGPVARVEDVLVSRAGSRKAAPDEDARELLGAAAVRAGWGRREPTPGLAAGTWRIAPTIEGQPLVSILIPFRDKPGILARAIESIERKSTWTRRELILIDNGSREPATARLLAQVTSGKSLPGAADISITSAVKVLPQPGPFNFARLNNAAAKVAGGDWLLLLNNDVEVIAPSWIEAMLEQAARPEVGVVGARLLFPEGFVQHAGVVLGLGGIAGHPGRLLSPASGGYHRAFDVVHDYSAVTAACLLVRRSLFLDVGGLDEERLAIGFNDVDFCLKLRDRGLLVVYTPFAELLHHESLSRGPRVDDAEVAVMRERWGPLLEADPYYNSNLSLQRDDFEVKP